MHPPSKLRIALGLLFVTAVCAVPGIMLSNAFTPNIAAMATVIALFYFLLFLCSQSAYGQSVLSNRVWTVSILIAACIKLITSFIAFGLMADFVAGVFAIEITDALISLPTGGGVMDLDLSDQFLPTAAVSTLHGVFILFAFSILTLILSPIVAGVVGRKKPDPNLCTKCGYDIRGTPDRCPECGLIPAVSQQTYLATVMVAEDPGALET